MLMYCTPPFVVRTSTVPLLVLVVVAVALHPGTSTAMPCIACLTVDRRMESPQLQRCFTNDQMQMAAAGCRMQAAGWRVEGRGSRVEASSRVQTSSSPLPIRCGRVLYEYSVLYSSSGAGAECFRTIRVRTVALPTRPSASGS